MIPGNQVLEMRPRRDATLSLETLPAPGVSHQGQILGAGVCTMGSPSFSDGLACGSCNPLSQFLSLGRQHQSFRSFQKCISSLDSSHILGPATSWKSSQGTASAFCITWPPYWEAWNLSLEKWWFRGCSFLLRSGLQHAEPTLPVGGMGQISSDSTPPLLPRGKRAFPRGRQSSLQGKDNLWSITQRLPGQRLQREGMKLQLADTSGGSGGYKNPSSAPFTAAGCWANDPMAPGLSLPSYKWGWW